ncbi:MAG: hypothetical protein AB8G18_07265 [Gammaproteobacteria bacterium]
MNTWTLALSLTLAQITLGASAGPITFDDWTDFENQGSIAEFQDFESFNPGDFTEPGAVFVDGNVTYTSAGDNLIVGADTFVNPISNTMSYDVFDTALTAVLTGEFNMFALDMAVNAEVGILSDVTLTLFTNVSAYLFDFALPNVQNAQLFQGFVLTGDEFFTGLEFSVVDFVHIDNVTLGTAVEVPEPPVILLVMVGALLMRVVGRKRV